MEAYSANHVATTSVRVDKSERQSCISLPRGRRNLLHLKIKKYETTVTQCPQMTLIDKEISS